MSLRVLKWAVAVVFVGGIAFDLGLAIYYGCQPRHTGGDSVLVRFDAEDKEARVVIDGTDRGRVPVLLFMSNWDKHTVKIGGHENPAYVPRHERYYVACDGTRLPD